MNNSLSETIAIVVMAVAVTICTPAAQPAPAQAAPAQGPETPAVGPRGPIGPDVPLSEAERKQFDKRITVEGRTAAAVQSAYERAVKDGAPVVLLPKGEYVFDKEVRVPGGVMLLGEGAKTLIRTKDKTIHLFNVDGDKVRFTRLKMQGAETTVSQNNDTYGISAGGKKNVRIDHCELLGFSYATTFSDEATAQVDHCSIHNNLREGLGYGVAIYSGACVLVTDNEFSQNRHSLASNGALDWSSGERLGKYVHKAGVRKTHWEFLHNRVGSNDQSTYELCAVDTHPGMDGTFVVEGNIFENLRHGIGIRDGAGLIRGNRFRNLRSVMSWRPVMAISIGYGTHNNIPVEGCMPHDVQVADNTFESAGGRVFTDAIVAESAEIPNISKYRLGKAENIMVEGRLIPETKVERPAPPIPHLREMDADGALPEPETR
ncbi:MAG: right-handed parallel beta-helix repeat-containing protein [Candidatus Sumerlaeota bacterium]|nr:right-handed parallel beta-helix repeat-containing protein [Candidatus Sumerlaeota bacterium]